MSYLQRFVFWRHFLVYNKIVESQLTAMASSSPSRRTADDYAKV